MNDLGYLTNFLGFEVHRQLQGIFLTQSKYIQDFVTLAHLTETTAMDSLRNESKISEWWRRPWWSNSLSKVGWQSYHLAAIHQIIQYLLGSPNGGLFFLASVSLQLQAYCDANCAGCPDTWKSTTGWCMFLGDSLISWKCKKQECVSKSSTKVEYHVMSTVCSEI